jgi:SMODS and SLOG-associating 2TM effector domain 1/Protein of unknown function (DUF4231)
VPIQDHVADRQAAFSATANHLKSRIDRVRLVCFGLSIGGAALAAIVGGLTSDAYRAHLAWPAASMLAVAAFLTARKLGREPVALYAKARTASEALKREVFLYATSAPPYNNTETRDTQLAGALDAIEKSADGLGMYERTPVGPGNLPRTTLNVHDYIKSRVEGQISYYRASADRLAKPSRFLHRIEFLLAGAAAVTAAIAASSSKGEFDVASLTAVVTTLAGIVLTHLQAARYDEQIVSYRATANRLANLKATLPSNYTAAEVAAAAEEIIAAETKSWQALWLENRP